MRIQGLSKRVRAGSVVVGARVEWEDAGREAVDLWVETDAEHEESIWPDPNAWLVLCLIPAWRFKERRVRVEGALCPVTRDGVRVEMRSLAHWYPERFGAEPEIESTGVRVEAPAAGAGSVSLMSCGVDSLATLRWNLLNIPRDHAAAVRATVMIERDEHPQAPPEQWAERNASYAAAHRAVAAAAGVRAATLRSNVWELCTNGYFYDEEWHGAVLAGMAGLMSRGYGGAYIGSSYDPTELHPWGSHPLLDPYYGSAHFRVEHHGLSMTRFEKTALVAGWPEGLRHLRVCQEDDQATNCGGCEKCIRTMAALTALGVLGGSGAFPVDELTPELLGTVEAYEMLHSPHQVAWYRELIGPLAARGCNDLVAVIRRLELHSTEKWESVGR